MNMISQGKRAVTPLLTVAALIVTGCAELQQLADSVLTPIERAQHRLQSQNQQVRMAALNDITDSENALKNVILGQNLRLHPEEVGQAKVNYPEDVRLGAVEKLFEKGKILALIELADDYRIRGDKMAMVNGDNPITARIKSCVRTVDGLEKLCKECSELRWKNDWTSERWFLIGTASTDDPCPLSNECLLWAVRHINDKAMANIFDRETGDASTAGEKVVKKMTDYGCLKAIAMDTTCLVHPRIFAAEKAFSHDGVNGNDIIAIIASFDNVDEEQLTQIAKAGLGAAKRIGAQNVVGALEGR